MSLRLTNDWKYIGNDIWDWEIYLVGDRPEELNDVVSVKYILHPTFPKPINTVKKREGGFRLKTSGWGTFSVKSFAYLKNGKKVKLEHELELRCQPPKGTSS